MRDTLATIELEAMLFGRHMAPARRLPDGASVLERSHYTLLTRLEATGPMSIGQLSDAFGLDASTLNRQTAAMMRADLVERIPDPDGGLARKFRITKTGKRRLQTERNDNIAGLGRVVSDWADADIEAFATLLAKFNKSVEERSGRGWPRTDPL
ncbi:MarR family winged helix-turn-helix transcriptional regulator [Cumulibacter soli]|uniref:MarR family winged helix-turn-helix transcriptional regulator n=1 Tax=Cumulibacter soli TaxID=2546344 RepID=UPI001FBB9212|nr:MarR family transcriptional regulator [Cumulibacter soli]